LSAHAEQSVCQSEYFRAKCSSVDEVLMVRSALYGRMHTSKCVKENFGFVDCSSGMCLRTTPPRPRVFETKAKASAFLSQ